MVLGRASGGSQAFSTGGRNRFYDAALAWRGELAACRTLALHSIRFLANEQPLQNTSQLTVVFNWDAALKK
jgi:hypothetical protein